MHCLIMPKGNSLLNAAFLNENLFFIYFFLAINKQKLILHFFFTTRVSEPSKHLNKELGVFLNVKQRK